MCEQHLSMESRLSDVILPSKKYTMTFKDQHILSTWSNPHVHSYLVFIHTTNLANGESYHVSNEQWDMISERNKQCGYKGTWIMEPSNYETFWECIRKLTSPNPQHMEDFRMGNAIIWVMSNEHYVMSNNTW